MEPINQPQIDTDFWWLPAASGRVHIIDDVCQRCGAGEHKRPLPVDSRQRAGAVAHRRHVAVPIAPGEAAPATIPERAAVIAQDLVEIKAKVTVGRRALDQVACDDAGHDRAVCQADVVQAGEVELGAPFPGRLAAFESWIAFELDRPIAGLRRAPVVVTASAITASDVYRNICFIGVVLCIFVFMLFNFLSL